VLTPLVSGTNDREKRSRQALVISIPMIPSGRPLCQKRLLYDPSVQGNQAPQSPSGKLSVTMENAAQKKSTNVSTNTTTGMTCIDGADQPPEAAESGWLINAAKVPITTNTSGKNSVHSSDSISHLQSANTGFNGSIHHPPKHTLRQALIHRLLSQGCNGAPQLGL